MRKLLLLLCFVVAPVSAETLYVEDLLRLGVRANPNSTEQPVEVITTGDAMTVLERSGKYIRVRTESGTEGWVSEAYVSKELPAAMQLERLKKAHATQTRQLETAQQELDAAQSRLTQLESSQAEVTAANKTLKKELSGYRSENSESQMLLRWGLALLVAVALFVFGVVLGISWQRRRVAHRLGGLQI